MTTIDIQSDFYPLGVVRMRSRRYTSLVPRHDPWSPAVALPTHNLAWTGRSQTLTASPRSAAWSG
jgi:hypothetical protein